MLRVHEGQHIWVFQVWVAAVLETYFGFSRSETSQWQKCSIRKSNRKLERMSSHILKRLSDSSSSLEIRFFGVNHGCRSVSLVVCWRNFKVFKIQNGGKTVWQSSNLAYWCWAAVNPLWLISPLQERNSWDRLHHHMFLFLVLLFWAWSKENLSREQTGWEALFEKTLQINVQKEI